MSGPVTFSGGRSDRFRCLTGLIRRAEQVGIFQRGTHRLIGQGGRVIATLRSNRVDLSRFEGQVRTVCGLDEGEIEGVTSLLVTQVLSDREPSGRPRPQPQPIQIDLRQLLRLLLERPDLVRQLLQGLRHR